MMRLAKVTTVGVVLSVAAFGGGRLMRPALAVERSDDEIPTSEVKATEPPVDRKMFPDGLAYDFGTVKRGTAVEHTYRVVNSSGGTLKILSLRYG